ncbi:hypothetical protein CI105_02880 [Candidatus Izimaplasma bacterium ZiA1]|uniref:ABC transporter ATP-binding protein/permease n=1 Tax=Candidatus Izimoplasma sp. ZiA1 TaxID=2024899 RepID=UPI000BAA48C9|nr:hypothetical protein CI105_02880 [Candidatus Izimaplasma bacterium ZiA1]
MLELKKITKIYTIGDINTYALNEVSLKFRPGEFVAILGPSGCGKTTLLNIIGGLDQYNSGDLLINNTSTKGYKEKDWDSYRNNSIGFVFQNYNLINHISILENVEMGLTLSGVSKEERKMIAIKTLKQVGLEDQMYKKSSQLSGGQKQRAAIARALVNDPDVILADEPTGALDSTTSVEVMNLIKEISKEKLVIMVTHNQEIADQFASRVVKLKDGFVIESSDESIQILKDEDYHLKKTSMSFFTALKLSFNNLKTKKGRTLITAFAGSIGIIGVALVLAISNGFGNEINKLESETLSTLPITITEIPLTFQGGPPFSTEGQIDNNTETFDPVYESEKVDHYNVLTEEYLSYLEDMPSEYISSIQYYYGVQMLFLYKNDDTITTSTSANVTFSELSNNSTYIDGQYDLVAGELPTKNNEVLIITTFNNEIDSHILEFLGFDVDTGVDFANVIDKEIRVAFSDDIEYTVAGTDVIANVTDESYQNGIILRVSGVVKAKKDGLEANTSGIYYHDKLENLYIASNIDSDTCDTINSIPSSLLSPDQLTQLNLQKHAAGCIDNPLAINIYPSSFEFKDEVLGYLDSFNVGLPEEDQLIYTDLASTISGIMGSIITSISTVLVAFAAISLIVSSIMIGIITYVSVLERTKEIGILRSLGARKKDISRVFNAESFIVGLVAGTLGVMIAYILSFPINIILERVLDGVKNVSALRVDHAIYLILISIALTSIAGLIPARIASRKDPVEALRHNE